MHVYQKKIVHNSGPLSYKVQTTEGLSPADIEIMLEALVLTMKLQKRQKIW